MEIFQLVLFFAIANGATAAAASAIQNDTNDMESVFKYRSQPAPFAIRGTKIIFQYF